MNCKTPDCPNPIENRDKGLCSSCGHAARKEHRNSLKEKKKYVIPKVSKKRKTDNSEYMKLKAEFMIGKVCPIYPHLPVKDIHHKAGRTGKLLNDTRYWLAVSRKGHIKITNNPSWSIKNGYSLPRT